MSRHNHNSNDASYRSKDQKDLAEARKDQSGNSQPKSWIQRLGPGLVTGAADDDPSGIGTYAQCGASFGFGLLWLIPFCLPLMIAVQEMCGRVGLVTGKGLAAVIRQHYPPWLLYGTLGLLFIANTLNVFADLSMMAASAQLLLGQSQYLWLSLITAVLISLQVFLPYRVYSRVLKFLCLSLLAYVYVALIPSTHTDWGKAFKSMVVPSFSGRFDYLLGMVAFLGTTISPYLFYWQAAQTVEEEVASGTEDSPGHRLFPVREDEVRFVRADTVAGMVVSQGIAFFIMIAVTGTLFASGKHDINTAQDAAIALKPLGAGAFWVFAVGMIGIGFVAIPTLAGSAAYAAAETFGWRYGLYRRLSRARAFYATVSMVIMVGYFLNFFSRLSPVKALVYSAVVNCIVAVPLLTVLLLICNNPQVVGNRTNGKWSNSLGVATIGCMGLASTFLIWALATGKAT